VLILQSDVKIVHLPHLSDVPLKTEQMSTSFRLHIHQGHISQPSTIKRETMELFYIMKFSLHVKEGYPQLFVCFCPYEISKTTCKEIVMTSAVTDGIWLTEFILRCLTSVITAKNRLRRKLMNTHGVTSQMYKTKTSTFTNLQWIIWYLIFCYV